MTHPRLRRLTAATTLLVLALSLAACSDDSGDDAGAEDPAPSSETTDAAEEPTETETSSAPPEPSEPAAPATVPTEDELRAALLTTGDVPDGFVEEPDDDDSNTFEGTCLGDIGEFDEAFGAEPDAAAEIQLVQSGSASQAFVGSGLDAYADGERLQTEFADFIAQLQDCTQVEATDDDGVAFELDIAYDDSVTVPDADQQLRIEMVGTVALDAETYDIAYSFLVSVTDNVVSLIGAYELGDVETGLRDGVDGWAELQAGRLAELLG